MRSMDILSCHANPTFYCANGCVPSSTAGAPSAMSFVSLLPTARRFAGLAVIFTLAVAPLCAAEPGFRNGDWPFQPLHRPDVPAVHDAAWMRNPIDAFVLAKLEQKGLRPSAQAERRVLLRRVTHDLTGLPPTVKEQEEFLADRSPEAYAKVVDRLLSSPRYGERWAQHWFDVVRFAETDGFKHDALRPNAYKYRDYVIQALNNDLPYDRFIRQQLAGDELEPNNPQAIIATGLNRLYPDELNASNIRQRRQELLDDVTDVTGAAFLGLTIGCARCHDHKFDPITQVDYYRLQAVFAPMAPRDDLVAATPIERHQYQLKRAAWEAATTEIRAQIDSLTAAARQSLIREATDGFDPDTQRALNTPESRRTPFQQELVVQAEKWIAIRLQKVFDRLTPDQQKRYSELQGKLSEFDTHKPLPLPTALAVSDIGPQAPPTYRLATGDYHKPQEEVHPGFPEFLGLSEPVFPANLPSGTTGRRAALANWLTRPDHPLTARVMVNRLWAHHFGVGIVGTPNDFGATGDSATHPELLDWLASEFVASGCSLKAMHRLMVTSAAYCQTSFVDPKNMQQAKAEKADETDRWLWRARGGRLEGEAIRDAVLQVAGDLNLRMYGPSARPKLPAETGRYAWDPDPIARDRNRRSVYVLAKRNLRYPLLDVFDEPDMHNSCPRRDETVTAPQALELLNSEFTDDEAHHWAARLTKEFGRDKSAIVRAAFLEGFGRLPSDDELTAARDFISIELKYEREEATAKLPPKAAIAPSGKSTMANSPMKSAATVESSTPEMDALADFCHALINSNEFLYVD